MACLDDGDSCSNTKIMPSIKESGNLRQEGFPFSMAKWVSTRSISSDSDSENDILREEKFEKQSSSEGEVSLEVLKSSTSETGNGLEGGRGRKVTDHQQKQMFGERLYPIVKTYYPLLAPKITGMLLELDNTELLHLLKSRDSLKLRIEEAITVLQVHLAKVVAESHKKPKCCIDAQEPISSCALAVASFQEQKQMIGEQLYPIIEEEHPLLASKITGMLLELDNSQLLRLLKCRKSLTAKVEKAIAALQAHQVKNSALRYRLCSPDAGGRESISTQAWVTASPRERGQMLGEQLYPIIAIEFPRLAPKITGMLLELDHPELLHMLESRDSLTRRIEEAVTVLHAHLAKLAAAKHEESGCFIDGKEPITSCALAAVSLHEQKQMIGERLYPIAEGEHPRLASKITGMLLELDNSELLRLLKCRKCLTAKVLEAIVVLQAHQAKVSSSHP